VEPGSPAVLGEVRIEGLGNLPEAPVRRALDLSAGDPYSTTELEHAQQAVLELGVFSSASVGSALDEPPPVADLDHFAEGFVAENQIIRALGRGAVNESADFAVGATDADVE
jgi:hypothetical protein